MNTKKTYELKNATFTAEVGTPAAVRALSDAEIAALVRNAMANWSFRRGARKESDGKHYNFAEVVADMLAVGERSSGPTDEDKKLADKLLFEIAGLPVCGEDIYRGAKTEPERDAAVLAFVKKHEVKFQPDPESAASDNAETAWEIAVDAVLHRAIAKYRENATDFVFVPDAKVSAKMNLAEFLAARRRDITRRAKTELV